MRQGGYKQHTAAGPQPDRRVFPCSRVRSSSFLVLASQIAEFSRAHGSDRRVFSRSRARSSSFLVLVGKIVDFSRAHRPDEPTNRCTSRKLMQMTSRRVPGRLDAKSDQNLNKMIKGNKQSGGQNMSRFSLMVSPTI